MKVEYKNTDELKILTDQSRKETTAFLKKLKRKKRNRLDAIVHDLHVKAFSEFNCLDCANCCKTIGPRLSDKDIEKLAGHTKMKPSEFMGKYIYQDEDNDYVFREKPCPFLAVDHYCLVYDQRPKACREYPHTNRKRFYQILDLTHKNCETCPIVFEIMEELKKEML